MMNKSYQSSEMGKDDEHVGDPEFHGDFGIAYQKVRFYFSMVLIFNFSSLKKSIKNRVLISLLPKTK